jgi:hypothetical protein
VAEDKWCWLRGYLEVFKTTLLSTRDEKRWLEILSWLDLKDPHYLPQYLAIYEKESRPECFAHFGGQGMLFVYGDTRNFIIYPFFKRNISELPFADNSVKNLYDIISPYGYAGPLAQLQDETIGEELWKVFFRTFDDFCRDSNIVSEFSRLHPIFGNHEPVGKFSTGTTQQLGQIVYVDLSCSEEEIFAAMSRPHRRRIRRAGENPDLGIRCSNDVGYLKYFVDLYTETMRRVGAHNKYLFSPDFFQAAYRTLSEHLDCWYVTYKGDIITGWLILKHGNLAYSWLSGSSREYFHLHADTFVVSRSLLQLKKEAFRYLILGGGRSAAKDSLFAFKAGFSELRRDFYVYKKVHLKKEYERLVKLQGHAGEAPGHFFPEYRLREAARELHKALQGMERKSEYSVQLARIAE